MATRAIFMTVAAALLTATAVLADDANQVAHDALLAQAPTAHTTAEMPDVNEPDGANNQHGDQGQSGEHGDKENGQHGDQDQSGELGEHGQIGEQGGVSGSVEQVGGGAGQQGGGGNQGGGGQDQDGPH
jgi:hypothetical protein